MVGIVASTWIFGEISGVNLVVRIVGAGAMYLAILWVFRAVNKEEIRWLRGVFFGRKEGGKSSCKMSEKA